MPKTEKVAEGVRELVKQYRISQPEMSARTIAKEVGLHHKTVSRILKDQPVPKLNLQAGLSETSEVKGDEWVITLPKTRIQTLEELVEHCKIDLSVWAVIRWTANKWEIGAKDNDGKIIVEPLFQVKAFLQKKKEVAAVKNEIEELKALAADHPWPYHIQDCEFKPPTGLMLELNLPDLHLGKLAWGVETGGPNYDVKIAESTFWRALDTLLYRVSSYQFDEILFVIGNDALHSDDIEGRTTAGTQVNPDARYHKTFATARTMLIKAIDRLKLISPVKILPCYGNHDRLSTWHLADSIEMYFTNDPRVIVDNRPRTRKYHNFGKVMLMFTHGDKGKKTDYPLLMATEEPEMFGRSLYRECHTGHTHMTKVDEQHGVRVRVLPALCPADAWHSEHGFVGNKRSAEAYVWDRNEGLISVVYHTEKD